MAAWKLGEEDGVQTLAGEPGARPRSPQLMRKQRRMTRRQVSFVRICKVDTYLCKKAFFSHFSCIKCYVLKLHGGFTLWSGNKTNLFSPFNLLVLATLPKHELGLKAMQLIINSHR